MTDASIAVVVGGAGSIGSAIVARLEALGHVVVVADVSDSAVKRSVDGHSDRIGVVGDFTTEDAAERLFATAAASGTVRILINSAGISPKQDGLKKELSEISAAEWRTVFDVNVLVPFLTIREAVRVMPHDGSASIVNIGSITARMGTGGPRDAAFPPLIPSASHYAASKAAVHTMGMSFARELAPLGIRVNTVAPGYVTTAMTSEVPDRAGALILEQVPLGRAATPDDVAAAVGFLTTADAAYLTGAVLDVNGGWLPAF